MIFSSMDRRHVSLVEVLGSIIGCSKRRASESSKHDEGSADTCTPQANERLSDWFRCASADELDVKGRPRNRPFSPQGVVQVRVCERGTMVRTTSSSGNTSVSG